MVAMGRPSCRDLEVKEIEPPRGAQEKRTESCPQSYTYFYGAVEDQGVILLLNVVAEEHSPTPSPSMKIPSTAAAAPLEAAKIKRHRRCQTV